MKLTPLLAGVLFGLAGFAGNFCKFELFFGVDFLFGSFFVMLALLRFGAAAGIIAGVIAATSTFFLWNHPWAIIIFSAEIAVAAYLHNRRRLDLPTAVVLYWLIPGALLVWLFYHGVMHIQTDSTILIVLKQAINGVCNALLAKAFQLILVIVKPEVNKRPGYQEFVATSIMAFVVFPALLYVFLDIRQLRAVYLEDAHRRSSHTSALTRKIVDSWVSGNHQTIKAMAAVIRDSEQRSLAEIQRQAEIFLASSPSFKRIGVMNRDAISIAYAPLIDNAGKSTLGLNFADRPYFPILKARQEPMVGDAQMGREGEPEPTLPLLAPMAPGGVFKGYCGGIIELRPMQNLLAEIVGPRNLVITLLDRQGLVISSTDPTRPMMTPWVRKSGETRKISDEVFHWLPEPEKGVSIMQRWRQSYYFAERQISPATGWTVMVEAPLLPALTAVTNATMFYSLVMVGLILLSSLVAFFISHWQSRPLIALHGLTGRVASHPELEIEAAWPSSPINEIDALSRNFRQMADTLRRTVNELFTLNNALEKMVALRTCEFQKSEERLRLALGAARQGWFDLDVRTGEATVSPDVARMSGYEPAEFATNFENWIDDIHPEDRQAVIAAYQQGLESGETVTTEYRRLTKAGEWLWLSSTGRVTEYDLEHKPRRVIGIHADINERKQTEERLRESEELFSLLMRFTPVYTFIKLVADGQSRVISVSDNFEKMLGIPAASMIGCTMDELFPADFARKITDDDLAVVATGKNIVLDETLNGRFYTTIKFPIIRKDGSRLLAGFTIDITERKQVEEKLRERENLFRSIFEQAAVGVALIDSNTGRFIQVNKRYCDIVGHDEADLLETDFLNITHPDDLLRNLENMDRLRQGKIAMFMMEKRYLRTDRGITWANLSVSPLWLPGESPTKHIAIIQDITAVKDVEDRLLELNRTLEVRVEAEARGRLEQERMLVQQSKMAAMGEMIAAIAHQWRQPLNAVAVLVQDIRDAFATGILDKEYLEQGVESAMGQIRFMSKTIDDFRNFFMPDKARTFFDAKKAMAEVIGIMSGQCRSLGISCSITCLVHDKTFNLGEPVVLCDEMRIFGFENELKQVFLNLLDNAKDAILERQLAKGALKEGSIRVEFDRDGERVVIRIIDNGGGIPDVMLDRIFEPYFTTKEQGKGTGIGLYMVKMIIENNMGGRISARNTDEGAEFTIVI